MSEVTKEDINRIYDKLEPIAEDVASIKTRLELLKQPCIFLESHIENHKEFKRPIVRAAFDLVKMAIVAGVTYLFVRNK